MAGLDLTEELIAEIKKKLGFIAFIYRPGPYEEIRISVNDILEECLKLKKTMEEERCKNLENTYSKKD